MKYFYSVFIYTGYIIEKGWGLMLSYLRKSVSARDGAVEEKITVALGYLEFTVM